MRLYSIFNFLKNKSNKEAEPGANETVIPPMTLEDVERIVEKLLELDPDDPLRKAFLIEQPSVAEQPPEEVSQQSDQT